MTNKSNRALLKLVLPLSLAGAVLVVSHSSRADSKASATWQHSYDLEAKGAMTDAILALEHLPQHPRDGYLYAQRRGWLYYRAGQHLKSVAAYRQASARAPDSVEARLGLLLPLMAQRRWQEAERVARDALRLDEGNLLASRRLALSLYRLGRFDEAEKIYRQILSAYPSDHDMLSGAGWCRLRQGDRSSARRAFAEVLEVAPRHASARSGMSASAM